METKLSNRIMNMTPSMTVNLTDTIVSLRRKGIDIIRLNIGEPDFNTPKNITMSAIKALEEGFTRYTQVAGCFELREAICKKFKRDNNIDYKPDEIMVSAGAKQALNNTFQALCNKGDEVIVLSPYWVSYVEMVKLAQGTPVIVELDRENGFQVDVDRVKKFITSKTKAILLNTPNNPTGVVYSEVELTKLGELAIEHDFYIVSDEIYEKFTYDDAKHISIASLSEEVKERVITINGFSKAYAMTGWRVGYAAGPKWLIKGMCNYQGHMTSAPNSIAQKSSIEALSGDQSYLEKMKKTYNQRREYLLNRLKDMEGIECDKGKGAFYLMPDISGLIGKVYKGKTLKDSIDVSDFLLEKAHVAVVPGIAFNAPKNIRIAYCSSLDDIKEGMDRVEKALGKLNQGIGNRKIY